MAQQINLVSARDLLGTPNSAFIDIRDADSYESGHLPGALAASKENIDAFLIATPKDTRLVVYCYHGHSSIPAADWFSSQGFTNVASMIGGFEGWRFSAINDKTFEVVQGELQ